MNMNNIVQLIYNLNGEIGIHWTHEDKVRFAEKIICECAKIAYENDAKDISNKIFDHFGI